ncbi:unnamed protein product [Nyctereutes procyonoides]|uniref:(raccoon dog) hypothetical protein n=1 Tax=Nyctereutes procyonoides TaxID=34880 RepID=A0A811XVN8_NYCPR|nr:unnamed protein product [Nyctereutes procyonoides]
MASGDPGAGSSGCQLRCSCQPRDWVMLGFRSSTSASLHRSGYLQRAHVQQNHPPNPNVPVPAPQVRGSKAPLPCEFSTRNPGLPAWISPRDSFEVGAGRGLLRKQTAEGRQHRVTNPLRSRCVPGPCCRPRGPRRRTTSLPGPSPHPCQGPHRLEPHGPRPCLNSALLWVAWPLCDTSAPLPRGACLWCQPRATSCPSWHPPVPPGPARASHPATRLAAFTVVTPLPPAPYPARGRRWALRLSLPVQQVRSCEHLPPSCPLPSPPVGPQPHSSGPSQALPTWVSSQPGPPSATPDGLSNMGRRPSLSPRFASRESPFPPTYAHMHAHTHIPQRHTDTLPPAHTHPHEHRHDTQPFHVHSLTCTHTLGDGGSAAPPGHTGYSGCGGREAGGT